MLRSMFYALALLASSSAGATATVVNGLSSDVLGRLQLIDLDPNDGIAPYFDSSNAIGTGDGEGMGSEGPVTIELLKPFGVRYTAQPGGSHDSAGFFSFYGNLLSPMTAVVFSVDARVAAFVSRAGEIAFSRVGFETFGATLDSTIEGGSDSIQAASVLPASPDRFFKTFKVRLDNATRNVIEAVYSGNFEVFLKSPVCKR